MRFLARTRLVGTEEQSLENLLSLPATEVQKLNYDDLLCGCYLGDHIEKGEQSFRYLDAIIGRGLSC